MRENVEKLNRQIKGIANKIQHQESAIHRINDPDEIVKLQFQIMKLRLKLKNLELEIQQKLQR